MTTLAIIPARAGSKRLPNKNMMNLCGHPLIHYSIVHAKYSGMVDLVVVSTDSKDIKAYCRKHLVECIDRPNELATDEAKSEDVVRHAIEQCNKSVKQVVLLQPTSPLRTIDDINRCVGMSCFGGVVSVNQFCDFGYKKNGAVYVWEVCRIMEGDFDFNVTYIMPPERSVDIDTIEDFEKAERIMREKNRV
jgi:CMP-N-acetylneuraminic acid synthetase